MENEKKRLSLTKEGQIIMATLLHNRKTPFTRADLREILWGGQELPDNWKDTFYASLSNAKIFLLVEYKYSIRRYSPKKSPGQKRKSPTAWKLAYTPLDLETAASQSVKRSQSHADIAEHTAKALGQLLGKIKKLPGLQKSESSELIKDIINLTQNCWRVGSSLEGAIERAEVKQEKRRKKGGKGKEDKDAKDRSPKG